MIPTPRTHATAARALVATLAVALLGGCTTQTVPRGSSEMAAMAPILSVERFLQAANARDLMAMQRLFGTYSGPVEGERMELELRMSAIAEVLQHQDYLILGERQEPGRIHPTTRVTVRLTKDGRIIPEVPFLVVRTADGGWLIEEIDLEKVTRG